MLNLIQHLIIVKLLDPTDGGQGGRYSNVKLQWGIIPKKT